MFKLKTRRLFTAGYQSRKVVALGPFSGAAYLTVFLCTWSILHLDVPTRHSQIYLILRKLGWMFIAAMAPEIILAVACKKFALARDMSLYLGKRRGCESWTRTHMLFAQAEGFQIRSAQGEISRCGPEELREFIEKGEVNHPSVSAQELESRGKSDWLIKLVAVLQILWFVLETLVRAVQHYQITAIEIMTVAFVLYSIFTYWISWSMPQDVQYPVTLQLRLRPQESEGTDSKREAGNETSAGVMTETTPPAHQTKIERLLSLGINKPSVAAEVILYILNLPVVCGFGAIHCLAWNSPFPTSEERLAWRICSVATTALLALVTSGFYLGKLVETTKYGDDYIDHIYEPALVFILLLYIIGRIIIIILAFLALRALPADAFQTVNWSIYIPHFAT